MGTTDMKRTFTSLVLGISLLLGIGDAGLAQGFDPVLSAYYRGDYATAFREWSTRAASGDAGAQLSLGNMYADGKGVTQDYREAVRWYRLSAEQGYGLAQSNLGFMYEHGQGVTQDYIYAHMWYNVAASQGHRMAETWRRNIADMMTSAQIARAQELARLCVAKNFKDC